MSAIVDFVLSSPGILAALCVAALWLWRRPESIAARRVLSAAALCYLVASIYAVPAGVTQALAHGYERFDARNAPAGTTALVVLGGGDLTVTGWDDRPLSVMNAAAAARVLEAVRVFRIVSPAWVISSGGGTTQARDVPSSVNMRDAFVALGVPPERILLESTSMDTHDEAVLIAPMLRHLRVNQVVLVTSDVHMRRSMGAFHAQGLHPIPAIAPDPRRLSPWSYKLRPTGYGLSFSAEVLHELIGIPYYWVRGWWRPTAP
jgi:uncharacterized SAM-binding protein YcdF (DUF218 family)